MLGRISICCVVIVLMPLSDPSGRKNRIDILPSILDYLHFDAAYFSFGKSVFDSSAQHCAFNFLNDTYQILDGEYSLILDTLQKSSLYHYTVDSILRQDIAEENKVLSQRMTTEMKAIIQNYNYALIKNKMKLESR